MTRRRQYSQTSSKIVRRGRGMAQKSLDLIEAMYAFAKAAQPITGRGIGYKLFVAGLILSMWTVGACSPSTACSRKRASAV